MKLVERNYKLHDSDSPLLVGDVNDEVIKEVKEPSYIEEEQPVGERVVSENGNEI